MLVVVVLVVVIVIVVLVLLVVLVVVVVVVPVVSCCCRYAFLVNILFLTATGKFFNGVALLQIIHLVVD